MRCIFLCLVSVTLFAAGHAHAQNAEVGRVYSSLQGEQLHLLADRFLVPLGFASGQAVGDVIEPQTKALIATAADCFPGLVPRRGPSDSIHIQNEGNGRLAAALGLGGVGDLEIAGDRVRRFELVYDEVERAEASRIQMRRALDLSEPECAALRPLLGAAPATSDETGPAPAILVAEVLYARRVVRILAADAGSAETEARSLSGIFKRFGFEAKVKVEIEAGQSALIEVASSERLPVAYRPAFVPVDKTLGTARSADGTTEAMVVTRWEEFDPLRPDHAAAWQRWLETWK